MTRVTCYAASGSSIAAACGIAPTRLAAEPPFHSNETAHRRHLGYLPAIARLKCPAALDANGAVDLADLLILLRACGWTS